MFLFPHIKAIFITKNKNFLYLNFDRSYGGRRVLLDVALASQMSIYEGRSVHAVKIPTDN
jgi:hypothetical protein